MLYGLELAWDKGCQNLQIEVEYSKSAIQAILHKRPIKRNVGNIGKGTSLKIR